MKEKVCCFFGHRKIDDTTDLRRKLYQIIENLITEEGVDTFLFGSKSQFDELCLEMITLLKEKYPCITRIYVRAEYPEINDNYRRYLLESYDDTYFPEKIKSAGKAVFVERNYHMIDKSSICVVYFSADYKPLSRNIGDNQVKSGTAMAYKYAKKKGKIIINVLE